jgi:hypothetical protein
MEQALPENRMALQLGGDRLDERLALGRHNGPSGPLDNEMKVGGQRRERH